MGIVAPSILAADFCNLGSEIRSIADAGAEWLHFDVMDGVFVPNISFGLPVLESIRPVTGLVIDAHLMICNPLKYVKSFCDAGADFVTVHLEAAPLEEIREALQEIRRCGRRAGISVRPGTPAEALRDLLPLTDLVLVMTVEPGFGAQKFMQDMLPKIETLSAMIRELQPDCVLEVDGGINGETVRLVAAAGANVFVTGSYFFHAADRAQAVRDLKAE